MLLGLCGFGSGQQAGASSSDWKIRQYIRQRASAEQALQRGLVNRVVAGDALEMEVESLVASIVAKPRVAVSMGKALFYRQLEQGIERAYADGDYELFVQATTPSGLKSHPSYGDETYHFDAAQLSGAYYPMPIRIDN